MLTRFGLTALLEGLPGEEGIHSSRTFWYIQIERASTKPLRENQVGELPLLLFVFNLAVDMDEQERQRGQALLTVNDKLTSVFVADDD